MSENQVFDAATAGFEWLQVESMRLMEEHADAEHGICGNEWRVIEELRNAEESGEDAQLLEALRRCACGHVAEMAGSMIGNA
ncbi:MAG: hypothetical protein AB7U81_15680 [Thiohalomonadaceae bacterium]